jgi:hypothetical protein
VRARTSYDRPVPARREVRSLPLLAEAS